MIYQLQVPGPVSDVEEVRILEWHGAAGKVFAENDLVVELETNKAVIEVRAGRTSILRAILCAEGDWQRIGEALALFSDAADEPLPHDLADLAALAVAFEVL